VWATDAAWRAIDPFIPTMDPFWREGPPEKMPPAAWLTPGGFHSFEHRWALDAAFRYHLALGKAKVAARLHELNAHVRQELAKMPHVRVVTPLSDELAAGITCFEVGKLKPEEVVARLRQKNVVASVTPPFYPTPYARLAAGLVNLESDVDAALSAVSGLA
jgi:selenocysteine lyase/cysteine desulfurase